MKNNRKGLAWVALSMVFAPAIACASSNSNTNQIVLSSSHVIALKPGEWFDLDRYYCKQSANTLPKLTVEMATGYPLLLQISSSPGMASQKAAMKDGDYIKFYGPVMDRNIIFSVSNPPSTRPQTIIAKVNSSCQS